MTLRPRKTNRRKRRRVIVDKQGFTSSPTLVMPELEYCTNCRKTVPVGDPKHALHSRFSLDEEASDAPVTRRDTAINLANASELVLPRFKTGWEGFDRDETDRRFLFGKKNRFGPAFETAIYDMTKRGLVEVGDVTSAVLEERLGAVGVVPFAAAHLARPVLLAVEASAIEIKEDMSTRPVETEGYPAVRLRRVLDRLQHDLDLITRGYALRVEVPRVLGDVVDDDELDLAVAAAVLSAIRNRPPPRAMVFGKVSFSGHVVSMVRSEQRLEAGLLHVLAINEAIVPMRTVVPDGVNARRVRSISELEMAMWPTGAAGSVGRVRQPTFLGELQVGALPEAAGDMVDAVRDADVVDEPVDDPVDEMIVAEWDAPMVTFLDDQSAGDVSITTDHGTTEAPRPKATRRSRKKG